MAESSSNNWSSGQGFGFVQIKSVSEVQTASELRRVNEELSTIVGRMARGQEDALAEFYDATSPMAFGLVLRILGPKGGDKEIAEEVLIQVYEQVWQQASSFDRDKGNPLSWLSSIARSKALDWLRSNSPTRPTGDTRHLSESNLIVSETFLPEVRIAISGAMENLGPEQREVIELAYHGGLNLGEIAARLNRPEALVKTQMRYGMNKLRELFNQTVVRN